ncbi:hypothetical protein T03_6998 [Trichinella britovi]|uniref:Uncharacterized protein n=1 Tax=Trichinella britovi TaxID=45882 RepID=A0A0V1AIU8_TRIBR|nr:hypothetical protein T03_6998 [Trichinella britovi]
MYYVQKPAEVLQILRPFIPQLLESSKLKSPKH